MKCKPEILPGLSARRFHSAGSRTGSARKRTPRADPCGGKPFRRVSVAFGKTITLRNPQRYQRSIIWIAYEQRSWPDEHHTSSSPRLRGEGRDEGTVCESEAAPRIPHPDPLPAKSGAGEERPAGMSGATVFALSPDRLPVRFRARDRRPRSTPFRRRGASAAEARRYGMPPLGVSANSRPARRLALATWAAWRSVISGVRRERQGASG